MNNHLQIWDDGESRRRLTRVALAVLNSQALAEEVVQEAFVRLLENEVGTVENPFNWLISVTRNLAIDKARRTLREREILLLIPGEGQFEQHYGRHATESRLAELVSCLLHVSDSHNTAVVLLHVVFGLSYEDIATICGSSPAACRQTASRALRKCFNAFQKDEQYDETTNTDMYVHAILDASMAPLVDSLCITSPVSLQNSVTNLLTGNCGRLPLNTGRTRQVLALTPTGVQWTLVLDAMILCFSGNSVQSSTVTEH